MRRLEMQFESFLEIGERLLFGHALACDVHFEALGHVPIALAPDGRREGSLHELIISQLQMRFGPRIHTNGHIVDLSLIRVCSCEFVANILIDQPAPQRKADQFAGAVEI